MKAAKPMVFLLVGLFPFGGLTGKNGIAAAGPSGYKISGRIPVAGDGGWDYVTVDEANRRLYVSHATQVVVFDLETRAVVGDIPDTQGVHGIAVAPELGRGWVSSGRANSVAVFDLKSLKTLTTVPAGTNPDAILYEPVTRRVFVFNGRSKDVTVIDAATDTALSTFGAGGKPEFAVADGAGGVYANVEDTSEILHIDAKRLTIVQRWPLAPCKEPTGLAIDTKSRRLFSVCQNGMMAVMDADTGKIVATPKIGQGPDGAGFNPATREIFSANGQSGTLTVIHENGPDDYSVVENVATEKSARTMAIDPRTGSVYLPAAELTPPPAGQQWPGIKPGTLHVLVVSK